MIDNVLTISQMQEIYPDSFLKVKVVEIDNNLQLKSGIVLASGKTQLELANNWNLFYPLLSREFYKFVFVYCTIEGFNNEKAYPAIITNGN